MANDKELKDLETTGVEETPVVESLPKKRGRKPNPNKKNMYFSDYEEEIFRQYLASDDEDFRNKVFNNVLYPVFTKMVESIIRRYILFTPGEDFQDTFNDAMSHLISKVKHFKPEKNKKAFSYCGTICKNYALHKRQKTQGNMQKYISYDTIYNDIHPDMRTTNETVFGDVNFTQLMMAKSADEISKMVENADKYNLNDSDIKVGMALVDVLRNWDEIFMNLDTKKYNKSQVDAFIKETTLLSTKQIRDAKKKYSAVYFKLKEQMLNED